MWLVAGAVLGLLAVAAGAFGAHALRDLLTEELAQVYGTAAQYHFYHAIALVAVGLLARERPMLLLHAAGACFLLGVAFFSGSLYGLALSGFRPLGMITPVGGVFFMLGWLLLAAGGLRRAVRPTG
jgi:uncharacterized membrane protein YgdD (TMEM256/DUF423 family)